MNWNWPLLKWRRWLTDLSQFPWRNTAAVLRERFREDRLGLTASSLTYTTTLALVPFITVALAVFTAFPIFGQVQAVLQRWLVQSLVPDSIARQVLGYLTQFAAKASRLGSVGLALVLVTALALILTIDRTLNNIWRVRQPRPLAQRVFIYWAAITLGPLLLGGSLLGTSYALSASRGLMADVLPGGVRLLLGMAEFSLLWAGLAALYRYVPNTPVKWAHAWSGGLFAASCLEIGKKGLSLYITNVPTYSMVYGAFATAPVLLMWIYVAWVIVLLGAVVVAYLPSLLSGVARRGEAHGWHFQLALEVLEQLQRARPTQAKGRTARELAQALRVDALQLEPVLEALLALDWVGRLSEERPGQTPRYLLLVDAQTTTLAPLVKHLLLPLSDATAGFWTSARLETTRLKDALRD